MPKRNRADAERRILTAALRLFARRGYHAVTTQDIARSARRNEALLFRYFGSKHGLLVRLLKDHRLEPNIAPFDEPERYSLETFLDMAAEDWYRAFGQDPDHFRLIRHCLLEAPKALKEYDQFIRRHRFGPMVSYLSAQQEKGRIRRDLNPLNITLAFVGIFNDVLQVRLYRGEWEFPPKEWSRFKSECIRLFVDGLTTRHPVRPALKLQPLVRGAHS